MSKDKENKQNQANTNKLTQDASLPVKRGRGRPRKVQPSGSVNENTDKIIMGDTGNNITKNVSVSNNTPTVISEPVLVNNVPVQNIAINKTNPLNLSMGEVSVESTQKRWLTAFNRYSSVVNAGEALGFLTRINSYTANDPFLNNARVKRIIAEGRKVNANEVDKYIEDPVNNERPLDEVSWALYYQSMVYMYLLRVDREVPNFNYFAVPESLDVEEYKKEEYKKEKRKVDSIMRVLKPVNTFKDMIIQMQNEGKIFVIPRISYDDKEAKFFTWQKLPNEYCKIVGFGSTERFVIMLDMSMFLNPMYNTEQFAPFIGEKWNEMISRGIVQKNEKTKRYEFNLQADIGEDDIFEFVDKDTWCYWYRLPQDMAFIFSADGSHPLMIPDYTGLIPDIADLSQYKLAQQTALNQAVMSVLTAEVPYYKDALAGKDSTLASPDTILGFTDLFEQKIGNRILPFFAPFQNFDLHNISDSIEPATTIVSKRIQDVINTAGMSGIINLSDRPNVAAVKTAQLLAEAKAKYFVTQFETAVNRIINHSFGLKYKWKIHFWGYAFTQENELKIMKEMILSGCKALLPRFLSAYNMTIEEYKACHDIMEAEDIKIIKDELKFTMLEGRKTTITSQQMKNLGDVTKNPVGRPKIDDNDIENENTAASVELGDNVSDVKDVYAKTEVFSKVEEMLDEIAVTDLDEDEVLEVIADEIGNWV